MNLLQRIVNLIRTWISRLLDRAENLEDQLTLTITEMTRQYETSQRAVTLAMVDEKKIRLTWEAELKKAQEWERRAILAVREANDDLAKQALLKQRDQMILVAQAKQDWERQEEQTEKLKESLKNLKERIERARRDYHLLVARIKSAEAQKSFGKTLGATGEIGALEQFQQLASKVEQLEIEAQAGVEVAGMSSGDADLEAQFARIEDKWSSEGALSALKTRLQRAPLLEIPPPPTP